MNRFFSLALAVVLGAGSSLFASDLYKIDHSHSTVQFAVKHMVLSNTRGAFGAYNGSIVWGKDIAKNKVEGVVSVNSIDTRDTKRDEHLRSADFFDAEKFPEIKFVSKSVKKSKAGYTLVGELTMKGVTKVVSLPLTVAGPVIDPWGNQRMNFASQFKIDRRDFGLTWSQSLDNGGLVVGNEVVIDLDIEGILAK